MLSHKESKNVKGTVKGLRRNPCTLPTFKRRIEEIRKRDSTTVHTEKKGPWCSWDPKEVIMLKKGHVRKTRIAMQSVQACECPFLSSMLTSFFQEYTTFSNLPQMVYPLKIHTYYLLCWQFLIVPHIFCNQLLKQLESLIPLILSVT